MAQPLGAEKIHSLTRSSREQIEHTTAIFLMPTLPHCHFLISNQNLSWCRLKPLPLVLSAFCLLALLGAALLVLLEKGQAVFPLSAWSCRGRHSPGGSHHRNSANPLLSAWHLEVTFPSSSNEWAQSGTVPYWLCCIKCCKTPRELNNRSRNQSY